MSVCSSAPKQQCPQSELPPAPAPLPQGGPITTATDLLKSMQVTAEVGGGALEGRLTSLSAPKKWCPRSKVSSTPAPLYEITRAGLIPILERGRETYFLLSRDGVEGFSAEYGGCRKPEDKTIAETQLREWVEETAGWFKSPPQSEFLTELGQLLSEAEVTRPSNKRAKFWYQNNLEKKTTERRGAVIMPMSRFGDMEEQDDNTFQATSLNTQYNRFASDKSTPLDYLERSCFRAVKTNYVLKEMTHNATWANSLTIGWGKEFLEDPMVWKTLSEFQEQKCPSLTFQRCAPWKCPDEEQAAYFDLAIQHNCPSGVWYQAYMFFHRLKQYERADACLKKALQMGNANAQFCHAERLSQSNKLTEAAHHYRLAAEQGHGAAQQKIGECFQNGTGVTQNTQTAIEWHTKAMNNPKTQNPEKSWAALNSLGS